jgi:predicted RNA-binding protein with PIN domain
MNKIEDLTKEKLDQLAISGGECLGSQIFLIKFVDQIAENIAQNIYAIKFKATKESMYFTSKSRDQLDTWRYANLFWSPGRFYLQIINPNIAGE